MNDEYFVDTYYDYNYDDDLSLFDRDLWGNGDSSRYGNWDSYHSHPTGNSTNANDGGDKPNAAVYVRAVLGFMVRAYLMLISCHKYCNFNAKHHAHIISPIFITDCPTHILCCLGICL